ncbi:unnamed protein product [Closterium sp. Yama58-4]|nr:unnamed protein product [Closterium sp. Yama58-4]
MQPHFASSTTLRSVMRGGRIVAWLHPLLLLSLVPFHPFSAPSHPAHVAALQPSDQDTLLPQDGRAGEWGLGKLREEIAEKLRQEAAGGSTATCDESSGSGVGSSGGRSGRRAIGSKDEKAAGKRDSGSGSAGVGGANIVLIMVDDTDLLLGSTAREVMPLTHAHVVSRGASLSNYFANFAICCPSRVSYLTGRCSHNTGVIWNKDAGMGGGEYRVLEEGLEPHTLAVALQRAGYRTALVGKYLNGYGTTASDPRTGEPLSLTRVPQGWHEWFAFTGVPNYYNWTASDNGAPRSYGDAAEDYSTDVLRDRALRFIHDATQGPHEQQQQPFLLYLAPYAAHAPTIPAPRHEGKFSHVQIPAVPNWPGDYAWRSSKVSAVGVYPPFHPSYEALFHTLHQKRLETLAAVDEMVDAVALALQAHGVADNTYIIFTTDNGYHIGHHGMTAGKSSFYEEDIRLFFHITGPKVPHVNLTHLIGNIDVAPTIAELAGAVFPPADSPPVDGLSFAPLLLSSEARALDPDHFREALLVEKIWLDSSPNAVTHDIVIADMHTDAFSKYRPAPVPSFNDTPFHPPPLPPGSTIGPGDANYTNNRVNKGVELTADGSALMNGPRFGNTEDAELGGPQYFAQLGYNESAYLIAVGFSFPSTYYALRMANKRMGSIVYADVGVYGHEFYNMSVDPFQLHNTFHSLPPSLVAYFQNLLDRLKHCSGRSCSPRSFEVRGKPYA